MRSVILLGMSLRPIEIVPCPPAMSVEALGLVVEELTPSQRREFVSVPSGQPVEALVIAREEGELIGAAWGQRQPGRTAIFWPPRWRANADLDASMRLACATARALDDAGIRMTQALLPDRESPIAQVLAAAGFSLLADLMYLQWEAAPLEEGPRTPLQFEPYGELQRGAIYCARRSHLRGDARLSITWRQAADGRSARRLPRDRLLSPGELAARAKRRRGRWRAVAGRASRVRGIGN